MPKSEEATQDDFELARAVESGDAARIREIRVAEADRRLLKKKMYSKGELISYEDSKPKKKSLIIGVVFAILAGVAVGTARHGETDVRKWVEIIADFMIAVGTGFTASGVVLNATASNWLKEIVKQEEFRDGKTRFVRESVLTRDLIALVQSLALAFPGIGGIPHQAPSVAPSSAASVSSEQKPSELEIKQENEAEPVSLGILLESLQARLKVQRSNLKYIYVISQKDLARIFLDASRTTLFGSLLIVLGTLALLLLAYTKS